MTLTLRICLIIASVLATFVVIHKIRKSRMHINDAVYWVLISLLFIILAIYPPILYFFTNLFGMQSPANLLFMIVIFLLIVRIFSMSIEISALKGDIKKLIQDIALGEHSGGDEKHE